MTTIKTWQDAEDALAAAWPGFSARPQQRTMATKVESVVSGGSGSPVLMAQAGCGVGKSLAYLIPSAASGGRTVVSVSTKALQDQLARKDLPELKRTLFPALSHAVLKGRSNYVCRRAAEKADLSASAAVRADGDGERSDLLHPVDDATWAQISVDTDGCTGRACPFRRECYSELAKAKALKADVLVVNTSLLTQDLKFRVMTGGKMNLLGDFDTLIVDEAHEMPDIVASGLSSRVTMFRILDLCSRLDSHLEDVAAPHHLADIRSWSADYFQHLADLFANSPSSRTAELDCTDHDQLNHILGALLSVAKPVRRAECNCERPPEDPWDGSDTEPVCEFRRRTDSLIRDLSYFASCDGSAGGVAWAEPDRKGRAALMFSPVEVGGFLSSALWAPTEGEPVRAVLTSATLGLNGDMTYLAGRLGLHDYDHCDVGTPFDYGSSALLFLPRSDDPSPKAGDRWQTWAQDRMLELVDAAGGGALLLFTSNRAMRNAYESMMTRLARSGHTSQMQGGGRTNQELAAWFAHHTDSVLFATRSFFTGVDFPGDACRLVVIDKMPFPSPGDPVFDARCKLVDDRLGQGSSFRRISMPEMSLVLIQAFGRLIRTTSDRGVVAILDNRMLTPWARSILQALPPAPRTGELSQVAAFYAAQTAAPAVSGA